MKRKIPRLIQRQHTPWPGIRVSCSSGINYPWEHRLVAHFSAGWRPLLPRSHLPASHRMWANVFRVLGKQGTGALISPTTRRAWLHRPPSALPATLAFASHAPGRLAPFAPRRRFTFAHVLSDDSDGHPSFQTTTATSFEDPSRRGLFYHLVQPPTPLSATRPAFAVSFLADSPPSSSESSTVLGWLPAETPGDDRDAGLNDFVENRARSSSTSRLRSRAAANR